MAVIGVFAFACNSDDEVALPPTIEVLNADQTTVVAGQTLTLRYTVSAPGGFASAPILSDPETVGTVAITQPLTVGEQSGELAITLTAVSPGTATVTLTVKDEGGQQVENQRTITVTPAPPNNPRVVATVVDTVTARADLSDLTVALTAAKLLETLRGDGPFTVFAPNNTAFAKLIDTFEEIRDIDELAQALGNDLTAVLQAHVVAGALTSQNLKAGDLATINDSTITVAIKDDNISVNGARLTERDLVAGNGVVHLIDSVINLPAVDQEIDPPTTTATVADVINTRDDLSGLKDAIALADLENILLGPGPFTVFASNNDAFTALLRVTNNAENPSDLYDLLGKEDWLALLQAHIIPDSLTTRDMAAGALSTLNGKTSITVTTKEGHFFVNGAAIVESDLIVANGVVHIIDSVINWPITPVGTTLDNTDGLDSMAVALNAVLLNDVLNDANRKFTVFAPDNAAFVALLQEKNVTSVSALRAALQNEGAGGSLGELLQGHIVEGRFASNNLQDGRELVTINGRTLTVAVSADGLTVNGIAISTTDQIATNGVIHTISKVIPAPTERENG